MWIDISTTDMAERAFLAAARQLSIPAQDWEDARNGIASLQQPWLLVLDNADDPEVDYQNYFPEGRYGVVIMTTRNNECQQYGTDKTIALQGLAIDEARDLLLKAARIHADQQQRYTEDATVVAGLLQSHPLALIQAGAYVSRGHCTLADYPLVYEKQRRRLLAYRPAQARSRYCDVYATFEVSAKKLAAMGTQTTQDALQLLPLLAVGEASQFPLSLFEAGWQGARRVAPNLDDEADDDNVYLLTPWHVAHIPSLCEAANGTWDAYRMTKAVACLKEFSLVSTHSQDNFVFVSLHPLVHAWARDRQDQQQQRQTWLQMACLVALAVRYEVLTLYQKRQLQPHVEALVSWSTRDVFSTGPAVLVARVLVNCGWYLYHQCADTKLLTLLHEIFTALELDSSKIDWKWIGLYDLAARNLRDNGKVRDAITLLEEVVKIKTQTLAEDNRVRLTCQYELASAYLANEQVKEAITLLEEVVKIKTQTLAEDDPDRLVSQHLLAQAYKDNGQISEAVTLLEEIMKIQKQTLAEDHPDRLGPENLFAICLWEAGVREVAHSLMAQVVEIRSRVLDDRHPEREKSEDWLAYFEREMAAS